MTVLQTVHRGLRQMKFALWTAPATWDTAYLIRGARRMSVELVVETDRLEGDDVVLDRFTKIISAQVNVEMATLDLTAASMFIGGDLDSVADYEDFTVGEDDDPPYIAIAGRIAASGTPGDMQILVPKARISGNIPFNAQTGSYILPGAQFEGVDDGAPNGIARIKNFRQKTALEIPLRDAVGGFA